MLRILSNLFLLSCISHSIMGIQWNGNWAYDCDFPGNVIDAMWTIGTECARQCELFPGCTHFSWSSYKLKELLEKPIEDFGGDCIFKRGNVNKNDAVATFSKSLCGYIDNVEALKTSRSWSDEFNSLSTFNNNWNQETGGHGWGNNELQYYTDNNRNTEINGMLTIHTRMENFGNSRYTSARLISKRAFKYGIYEMRARLPQGRGSWPAFWLLAAKRPLNWPGDGEIDIMEHVGYDPNVVHATIHCDAYNHVRGTQIGQSMRVNDVFRKFHNYQIYWSSKAIRGYIDGVKYFDYEKPRNATESEWPFDREFNIILNTAVGGNWGGVNGVDDSIFPLRYTIDYVRLYNIR